MFGALKRATLSCVYETGIFPLELEGCECLKYMQLVKGSLSVLITMVKHNIAPIYDYLHDWMQI